MKNKLSQLDLLETMDFLGTKVGPSGDDGLSGDNVGLSGDGGLSGDKSQIN